MFYILPLHYFKPLYLAELEGRNFKK